MMVQKERIGTDSQERPALKFLKIQQKLFIVEPIILDGSRVLTLKMRAKWKKETFVFHIQKMNVIPKLAFLF